VKEHEHTVVILEDEETYGMDGQVWVISDKEYSQLCKRGADLSALDGTPEGETYEIEDLVDMARRFKRARAVCQLPITERMLAELMVVILGEVD
jgi:hypothetical protein